MAAHHPASRPPRGRKKTHQDEKARYKAAGQRRTQRRALLRRKVPPLPIVILKGVLVRRWFFRWLDAADDIRRSKLHPLHLFMEDRREAREDGDFKRLHKMTDRFFFFQKRYEKPGPTAAETISKEDAGSTPYHE